MKKSSFPRGLRLGLLFAAILVQKAVGAADPVSEPLHCRIDRLIDSARVGPAGAQPVMPSFCDGCRST